MAVKDKSFLAGSAIAAWILAGAAVANPPDPADADAGAPDTVMQDIRSDQQSVMDGHGDVAASDEADQSEPQEDLQEAAEVLAQLKQDDPEFAQQLADAKAIFVIPDYATASLLVGGAGGEGVLLSNDNGQWGNPGFYDIGNIDIGLQAGGAAGAIVMALMSDEAVQPFHSDNDFALTAEAGLTIVNWSAEAQAGGSDVIVWSDTEGLLAEASVGIGGMSWDEEDAKDYYGQDVGPEQVLAGNVENPHEATLQSEFAEFSTSTESDTESSSDWQSQDTETDSTYDETQPQYEYDPEDEQ